MGLEHINFLGTLIDLPIHFNAMLKFSDKDKMNLPWLSQNTRYYGIDKEIGKGGRAVAYKGFASDEFGNRLSSVKKDVVLKIPNLKLTDDSDKNKEYLSRQSREGGREWKLTRERLEGCKFANPIFDFTKIPMSYYDDIVDIPITVQFFLDDAKSLDDFLLETGERAKPYMSLQNKPVDNWNGMSNPSKWLELAIGIATGLVDIHQRRVVHADIWPPNIFIKTDDEGKPYPVFIDFGEAFSIEPTGVPRSQRDHAYRAPERKDAQSIVTQMADVYSFGKLLLHLGIGEEPILSSDDSGHLRRAIIRSKFEERNHTLIENNPFILDIICKCVSLDPIDRPNMNEVLKALKSYVRLNLYPVSFSEERPLVSERLTSINNTWQKITQQLADREMSVGPFLEELVEHRIHDIEELVKGLSNDVINLSDTREKLIVDLLILFQRLGRGDRFISITHPRMWQGSALGLDGRYLSATQSATVRGASIQRVFLFSIQEIGQEWASKWVENLRKLSRHEKYSTIKLANLLELEINKYLAAVQQNEAQKLPEYLQKESRERLSLVIKSYVTSSKTICRDRFDKADQFSSFIQCEGLFLGLLPVSTLKVVNEYKSSYPVSIFYYSSAAEQDQYLLMMTVCLGRNSFASNEITNDIAYLSSKPELRGLMVFKSVFGFPEDRIKKMERILKNSVSVGSWIEKFYETLPDF